MQGGGGVRGKAKRHPREHRDAPGYGDPVPPFHRIPGLSCTQPAHHRPHFTYCFTLKTTLMMKKETWKQIIQILVTVLTAISSTILVQSCIS